MIRVTAFADVGAIELGSSVGFESKKTFRCSKILQKLLPVSKVWGWITRPSAHTVSPAGA